MKFLKKLTMNELILVFCIDGFVRMKAIILSFCFLL